MPDTTGPGGAQASPGAGRTFVLVHGAWHGGWCWEEVAGRLRAAGHRVFTPTQTGLGERSHLLSREVTLDTFVDDIANVLRFEQLEEVVLVGHSFGGLPISGVADRMPERLRQLVYLDAQVLEGGEASFDRMAPDIVASRLKAAEESSGGLSLPVPPAEAFGILRADHARKLAGRLTPHPLATYRSALRLAHPLGNGVPATYIVCTDPLYAPLAFARDFARAAGWPVEELASGHDAMIISPVETADLLMKLAG